MKEGLGRHASANVDYKWVRGVVQATYHRRMSTRSIRSDRYMPQQAVPGTGLDLDHPCSHHQLIRQTPR